MKRFNTDKLIEGLDSEKDSINFPCIFKATDTDTTYIGNGTTFTAIGGGGGAEPDTIEIGVSLPTKFPTQNVVEFDTYVSNETGQLFVTRIIQDATQITSESTLVSSNPAVATAAYHDHHDFDDIFRRGITFTRTGAGSCEITWDWNGKPFKANISAE